MESSSSEPITWGATQARNQAEELRQWEETPTHEVTDKKDATSDAKQPYDTGSATQQSTRRTNNAHEDRDDEQEFHRIPIAGEDSEDYQNEYWETESDEDKDSGQKSNEEEHDNENKIIFTTNMNRIVSLPPTTPLTPTIL
jgi:hypothetical protein